jgi:uncharacterized protein YbjT (DUF2867 family)
MLIAVAGASGRLGTHLVKVLEERGHGVVPISRTHGLDVITAVGLEQALRGVDGIIDAATGPSPDEAEATAFFTTASRNLHEAGHAAGVQRMLVVSIVGIDGWADGYGKAKLAHEKAALGGPVPTRILRATQFHEFVGTLLDWGTQGEVGYVSDMRTQLVAARSVAEAMANLATAPVWARQVGPALEIGGPPCREPGRRGHPARGEARSAREGRARARRGRPVRRGGAGLAASGTRRDPGRADLRGLARDRGRLSRRRRAPAVAAVGA